MSKTFSKPLFDNYQKFLEGSKKSYFQQTREWAKVLESMGKDRFHVLISMSGKKIVGALPIFLYKSKYGNIINSIPYPGPLGGVIAKTKNKEKVYKDLFSKLEDFAHKNNVVLATFISSPFWPDDFLYQKYLNPDYSLENFTLYLDLTKPRNTNSHFRNNLKRMLKKAEANRLNVVKSGSQKDLIDWYKIHSKRHNEIGIEPLPKKIFLSSLKYMQPADKGTFFYVKTPQAKIIAGCFIAYHNRVMDTYMISGNNDAYRNGAIYLLIHCLLTWAKEKGFKYFNWQSSKPKGGGPYNFKMQWGSIEAPYFFFTKKYGPIDKILERGLEKTKKEYRWHFVLPYSEFEKT